MQSDENGAQRQNNDACQGQKERAEDLNGTGFLKMSGKTQRKGNREHGPYDAKHYDGFQKP